VLRTGRQRPTFEVVGDYDFSFGEKAVEAFEDEAGATFDDAQKYEIELFLARKNNGSKKEFAALTIGVAKPRQNGKSYAARWYAVDMALAGMRVLYSAHHSSTTAKMFKELCAYFEDADNHPEIAAQVIHVSRARGYESIELDGNGCIDFQTRTNAGGRGGTYDIIIVDEAQELTYDQLEALLPTMSASGHEPQIIYIGTPPSPACLGTVFKDMHDKAHSSDPGSVWWLEWSVQADSIDGIDVNDKDLWYETNPAMGTRIMERTVQNECDTMRPDGFARERLGWWSPVAGRTEYIFDPKAWDACATEDEPIGTVCYGVKLSPDGSEAALSACWQGDIPHFELVDYRDTRRGVGWLADWLDARASKCAMLAVDGRNADALTSRLENYKDRQLHVMRTGDAIAAAALMLDGINSGTVTHYGQAELDEQAKAAVRRKVGRDAWCIGGEHPTAIESAACALWAAKNAKYKPGRKARIG